MTTPEIYRILAPLLRLWTDQGGANVGLEPEKAKPLLLWALDLPPLEWVCWRN